MTQHADPLSNMTQTRRAQLLVVDDQPINIRILHQIFAAEHDVFMATSGEQALAFCEKTPPDLVLLDVVMQGLSGLEVCAALKQQPETASIPVIFVTALDHPEEEAACWKAGGVDFITKPINAQTTRNRVRAHLTLKYQSDMLRQLAWIDGLTGVANRRQFDERLPSDFKRCRRAGVPMSVAQVDVDFFKRYNDALGHLAGDDCLRQVAIALRDGMYRPADLVARTGGEEFTVLMPEIDADGARVLAERLASAVRGLGLPHPDSVASHVTVSIGVATSCAADERAESLLQRADRALYLAKQRGRAQVAAGDGVDSR